MVPAIFALELDETGAAVGRLITLVTVDAGLEDVVLTSN
jgi:hypothetical protein